MTSVVRVWMKVLKLDHNRIHEINITYSLKSLINLNLDGNPMEYLNTANFRVPPSMKTFSFINNNISLIDENTFQHQTSPYGIYLNGNRIEHFDFEMFSHFEKLEAKSNHVTCSCPFFDSFRKIMHVGFQGDCSLNQTTTFGIKLLPCDRESKKEDCHAILLLVEKRAELEIKKTIFKNGNLEIQFSFNGKDFCKKITSEPGLNWISIEQNEELHFSIWLNGSIYYNFRNSSVITKNTLFKRSLNSQRKLPLCRSTTLGKLVILLFLRYWMWIFLSIIGILIITIALYCCFCW